MDVRVLSPELSSRAPAPELRVESAPPTWDLCLTACILSSLLARPVTANEIRDRALALGLLRSLAPGERVELSDKALSRLLLAGYRLPAHATAGPASTACLQVAQDNRVYVSLERGGTVALQGVAVLSAFEVVRANQVAPDGPLFCLRPAQPSAGTPDALLPRFAPARIDLDVQMVVAGPGWHKLFGAGHTFFGGSRDSDGTYHWDVAECATDAEGTIVRYYRES